MKLGLDFEPVRLREARKRVERAHPGTAATPRPVTESVLTQLRRAIEQAADVEASLNGLARQLSGRMIRALVQGLEQWPDLRGPVAYLLRQRLSVRLMPLLWAAWQRNPLLSELADLLVTAGEQFGWGSIVSAPYVEVAPKWVSAADPGLQIQRWLDEQSLTFSHLAKLADQPIRPDTPLARSILNAVLTSGSRNQLTEEAKRLPLWHQELSPELRIRFGQNYLTKIPANQWDRVLIERFRSTYGLPKKPTLERFWEPISVAVRERFHLMFVEQEIREAFRGDAQADREEFWRTWAGKIVDVERRAAGEVQYAYIEFPTFAVFEFFETGHAAYFYLPVDAERLMRKRPASPSDLKEKKTPDIPEYGFIDRDNRLIHNPPWGWHINGRAMVLRWLKSIPEF